MLNCLVGVFSGKPAMVIAIVFCLIMVIIYLPQIKKSVDELLNPQGKP